MSGSARGVRSNAHSYRNIVDATAGEGSDAILVSLERDGGYAIATFRVDGIMRPQRLAAPPALEPNPVSPLRGLADARRARLLMQGGGGGCFHPSW